MEHIVVPRRSHYLRLVLKRVLHLLVKFLVLILHGFKYHTFPTLMLTMIIVASTFYLTDETMSLPFVGARGAPIYDAQGRPMVVEQFFRAQQAYDAAGIWETYSDSLKQSLLAQGRSVETFQSGLNLQRLGGAGYLTFAYVFSDKLASGNTIHVYTVVLLSKGQQEEIRMTFELDEQGKIVQHW